MTNLKDYREKELKWYVIALLLFLLYLNKSIYIDLKSGENIDYVNGVISILDTIIISSCIYVFIFIFDSIFSSYFKEKIISLFGIWKLPGYTVFEKIRKNNCDKRFTAKKALSVYEDIYVNMPLKKKEKFEYQNEKWNDIYSKYREESIVFASHRDYLLCRDLTIITFIMGILYGIAVVNRILLFYREYIFLIIALYVICLISTHIKAKRFVYNVVACDLSNKSN